jgi:Bifunctional DNA primase/polymerase, N-terminal
MHVEKIEADHERARSALGYYEENKDAIYIAEEPQEDKLLTAKIAKKVADAIMVLRPRVLVSASEEVFEHHLLTRLRGKFSQTEEHASLDVLCLDVKRSNARTVILINPVAIDYGRGLTANRLLCPPFVLREACMTESFHKAAIRDIATAFNVDIAPQSNLDRALALAELGLAVHPCRSKGGIGEDGQAIKGKEAKTPLTRWKEAASTDPATIRFWWSRWPDALVGLVTGKRNGIAVADLDIKNGSDWRVSAPKAGLSCLQRTP